MQALRRGECCGDNSIHYVLQDNSKNYAFTGIKWNIFDDLPPDIKS